MTRRCLLILAAGIRLRADAAQEVWDLLTSVASAIGEGNAARCLAAFDPAMPGMAELRANIQALVKGSEVQVSIDLVEREEDAAGQSLELDWLMTITQRDDAARATRRREKVKCRVEKGGKKWRIVSFEPAGLFAPPRV
jgi:hypothetical protein